MRSPAQPQGASPSTETAVPALAAKPLSLGDGIFLLGELRPSVAYAVDTEDGIVLIDAGLDPQARSVRSQLARLGLDWKRIRWILLTHMHGDHSLGANYLRAQTGARVACGKRDAQALREGRSEAAFFSTLTVDGTPRPIAVDRELSGGETVQLGGARFEAIAAPGHTPGSLLYRLELGRRSVLFTGDVIMSLRGNPRQVDPVLRTPLGTYSAYRAPCYRGNASEYRRTLERLKQMPVPTLILPGHPSMDPAPESPRISAARWQEILDTGLREMATLQERYARDGTDFLDGNLKRLETNLYYLGDLSGRAIYGLATGRGFVLVTPTGTARLPAFVRSRMELLKVPAGPVNAVLLTTWDGETAGLRGYARAGARLFVPREALPAARGILSSASVAPALALPSWGLAARAIPLRGMSEPGEAYLIPCAGKSVLFSGTTPVLPNEPSMKHLHSQLMRPGADPLAYGATLAELAELNPGLWLPSRPSFGQNANVYPGDWEGIISWNLRSLVVR